MGLGRNSSSELNGRLGRKEKCGRCSEVPLPSKEKQQLKSKSALSETSVAITETSVTHTPAAEVVCFQTYWAMGFGLWLLDFVYRVCSCGFSCGGFHMFWQLCDLAATPTDGVNESLQRRNRGGKEIAKLLLLPPLREP